jgi:hypothetical protein
MCIFKKIAKPPILNSAKKEERNEAKNFKIVFFIYTKENLVRVDFPKMCQFLQAVALKSLKIQKNSNSL